MATDRRGERDDSFRLLRLNPALRDQGTLDRNEPGCRAEEDCQEANGGEHVKDARRAALADGEANRRGQADDQECRLEAVDTSKRVREGGLEVRKVGSAPGGNALPRNRNHTTGEQSTGDHHGIAHNPLIALVLADVRAR